jgi:hypothetical protein
MREGKAFQYSILAGWLITASTVLLVATILIPEESRSAYFWNRVCWTQFLVFLYWGSTGLYLLASGKSRDHVTRFGGIAPTISIVAGIYAMLSFAVMMIHAFAPVTDTGNRIHLIVQVVFFAGAALCVVFLSMARAGAAAGIDFDKTKAMSPRELHDLLALHESSLSQDNESASGLKAAMKQLRETLLHSLNESAALAQSSQYQSLSGEVQELCLAIAGERDNRYGSLTELAKRLAGKAKHVSTSQAVR